MKCCKHVLVPLQRWVPASPSPAPHALQCPLPLTPDEFALPRSHVHAAHVGPKCPASQSAQSSPAHPGSQRPQPPVPSTPLEFDAPCGAVHVHGWEQFGPKCPPSQSVQLESLEKCPGHPDTSLDNAAVSSR